jgi:predicted acylesterase/phospholipase RssA
MTSERAASQSPEGAEEGIPIPHFATLRAWFKSHPERVGQCFESKLLPRQKVVYPSPGLREDEVPRLMIVLSGELSLIQLVPGYAAPHRTLYRGDVWTNPNPAASKQKASRAAVRLESVAASRVLLLTQRGLRALPKEEAQELERILDDHAQLGRSRRSFFNALRSTVQFQRVGVRHLHALLDTADIISFESSRNGSPVIISQGSTLAPQEKGVFLVLEGMLGEWREPQGTENKRVLTRAIYPGHLVGDVVLHSDAPAPSTVQVHSSSALLAFLPEKNSELLIRRSPLFASAVGVSPADDWKSLAASLGQVALLPEVVLFRTDAQGVPLKSLIQAVAEATYQSYGDHILRVELEQGPAGADGPAPAFQPGPVPSYRVCAPTGAAAAEALQKLAEELRGEWDYFFVQVAASLWPGLVPPAGSAPGFQPLKDGDGTWKLVYLSRDPLAADPPPGYDRGSILYSALLEPGSEATAGPAFPAGTVRLPLALPRFSGTRTYAQSTGQERETFRRWGRAITERVVGIALGAGGSWGYAEIAVIRGMLERKIPIDVLSGTSFGAVAGAFYSGMGLEGLDLLLKKGGLFLGIVAASVINSSAITRAFDCMLGKRRLEQSALPFFPVGTDVSLSQAWVLQRGTLGAAIRSSGIMPGLLSPDFTDMEGRVVDGAFINSVPASVLMSQRANLIVATNVLSDPPDHKDSGPLLPGDLGWFLHGLNPLGRIADLVRSTLILFHSGGDKNAYGSDVVFDLPFTAVPPWAFGKGQEFVDQAASMLGPTLDEIEARWKVMAQRRGELLTQGLIPGAGMLP